MKQLKQFLIEAFDSPVEWFWRRKFGRNRVAAFSTPPNIHYTVFIDNDGKDFEDGIWSLMFLASGSGVPSGKGLANTGTGNQMAVFSTVIAIVLDFIKKEQPNHISFEGDKELGKAKLYAAILNHYKSEFGRLGYEFDITEESFLIYKIAQP